MIAGIDHIALSCLDVKQASDCLTRAGFSTQFSEIGQPNHPEKKPFLSAYASHHDIAYCRREDGIAIELTDHHTPFAFRAAGHTGYHVWFSAPPVVSEPLEHGTGMVSSIRAWTRSTNQPPLCYTGWPAFSTAFWRDPGYGSRDPVNVQMIFLGASLFEKSVAFWQNGLGFSERSSGETGAEGKWNHMAFASPVKRWSIDLCLLESPEESQPSTLDAPGFRCLAFITTDLKSDLLRLQGHGGTSAVSFDFFLNEKPLRIGLLRGPSGEIIELIEFQSKEGKHAR